MKIARLAVNYKKGEGHDEVFKGWASDAISSTQCPLPSFICKGGGGMKETFQRGGGGFG